MDAMVVGNGPSRDGLNISLFYQKLKIYGCNAVIRDYPDIDYVTYIDPGVYQEFLEIGVPKKKIIAPTYKDLHEPEDYAPTRFKNNAGVFAMSKAVEAGAKVVYCVGMDCLLNEGDFLGNIYLGTRNFDSKVAFEDQQRRRKYVDWYCETNKNIKFIFAFPNHITKFHNMYAPNIKGIKFDKLIERFINA